MLLDNHNAISTLNKINMDILNSHPVSSWYMDFLVSHQKMSFMIVFIRPESSQEPQIMSLCFSRNNSRTVPSTTITFSFSFFNFHGIDLLKK